ncbi:hypothetical protein IKE67_04505 [bacterium]|nr:hypothetical protein [bacterium]
MQSKIFKILFSLIFCFIIINPSFAVGETQIPVSQSYTDAVQSATNQINTQQQTVTTQAPENKNETLAHQAVTGSIDEAANALKNQTEQQSIVSNEIKKQTKTKKSYVNIIFKFILAMVWVCISSVIIFIILISYKKLILKGKPITPTYESLAESLETPKNFKEAIKLFLDKTKWD